MKHGLNFKRFFTSLMLLAVSTLSWAYDFEVNGIYYNMNSDETSVTVTMGGASKYSGAVNIPSTVTFDEVTYNVTLIGVQAFYKCSDLTSIAIPNSVTSIGDYAFWGCSGLTSVTIGNSVTSIGISAFSGCDGLTKAEFASIESLCNISFKDADSNPLNYAHHLYIDGQEVKDVVIPGSLTSIGPWTFENCSELTSVTIPGSMTSIGKSAFSGCDGLTKAEFASIESLCNISFEDRDSNPLTYAHNLYIGGQEVNDVVIPNSVTSIGNYVFRGCRSLTFVFIPNSVTSIGDYAFEGCSGLMAVTIPNSVTSIGDHAFSYSGLTSVTIGKNVTSIGPWAFEACGFTSVTIPNGVTTIEGGAFAYCPLTSVTIPNSVTSIGGYAFRCCGNLTSVTLGSGVTHIVHWAFEDCGGLTTISIPESVTSIGELAFRGCSGLASISVAPGNTKYDSRDNCNAIIETATNTLVTGCKNTVIPDNVTSIGNSAFDGCTDLTSINIPDNVTSIGQSAFIYCHGLTSVTIPNSVTSIGGSAFRDCSGLTSVTCLAKNVPTTDSDVFYNVPQSTATLYVPAGSVDAYKAADQWKDFGTITACAPAVIDFADANVKAICVANWDTNGDGELSETEAAAVTSLGEVFKNNTTITSFDELQYFTGLTSIGSDAFYGCSELASVTIPNSVTSIGEYAFQDCYGLTSVTIGNSVTSIGIYAFWNCSGLTSVTIPNSVTSIGSFAFENCSGLTSVTIPESVTSIDDCAFNHCSGLTSIFVEAGNTKYDSRNNCNAIIETSTNTLQSGCKNTIIPNSVTSIGASAFTRRIGLTSITIPESVTSIGGFAFYGCSGLTSIDIPNSVTSIGRDAFSGCSGLTSVTIGNSVTSIGFYAFAGCSGLTSVTIPNSVTSIDFSAFQGCSGLTSVTIGNNVTSIGESAFRDCSGLTSVHVYNSNPVSITSSTFDNRANATLYVPKGAKAAYEVADYWKEFKEIVELLPEGSTFVAKTAEGVDMTFKVISNSEMTCMVGTDSERAIAADYHGSITIPESVNNYTVTRVGSGAFLGGGLTAVEIPNSVTSIGVQAFNNCGELTSIALPQSLRAIEFLAFQICTNITSITIPQSVTYICDGAMPPSLTSISVDASNPVYDSRNDCNAIIETATNKLVAGCVNTVIPNDVKIIGAHAFASSAFSSVDIPEGVETIEYRAFWDCQALSSVLIPSSVKRIEGQAFAFCENLDAIVVEEGNSVYDSRGNCNAIIETASNTLIVGCKNTVIPNDVTGIGGGAFYYQHELTSVIIPSNVTFIDGEAFRGTGLTSITIPKNVSHIGGWAFVECGSLNSFTLRNPQPIQCDDLGMNRSNITLYVPQGTKAAYEAADYWKEFKEIIELSSIINFADANVKQLCVANWDTSGDGELDEDEAAAVTDLGEVFTSNKTITSFDELQYFTGLTTIGAYAFLDCSSLTSVTIPENVLMIYAPPLGCPFTRCTGLMSISVAPGNPKYDSRDNCNAIIETESNTLIKGCENTIIPNGVTSIGNAAFCGCSGLTSIDIPNSVTGIDYMAFSGCSGLISVTIPNNVTRIAAFAFEECSSLRSVTCLAENVPWTGDWAFVRVPQSDATLYVPKSSVNAYKAAEQWKEFGNIVGIDPTAVEELKSDKTIKANDNAPIFDLMGRRLQQKPASGYYIQGGKKYFVK